MIYLINSLIITTQLYIRLKLRWLLARVSCVI